MALGAIVVEGSQTDERGGFFTANIAKFRSADDEGECGALSDAIDACRQRQAVRQVLMLSQLGGELLELERAPSLEANDLAVEATAQLHVPDGLTSGLEANDVLLDLLDERQMLSKRLQTRIRRLADRFSFGRTGGNQHGVDLVVFGPLQTKVRIGAHL